MWGGRWRQGGGGGGAAALRTPFKSGTALCYPGLEIARFRGAVSDYFSSTSRLLQSFQNSLEEITIVALPEDMHGGQAGKAVQLHSYWDPAKSEPHTVQPLSNACGRSAVHPDVSSQV
jgi:hypothetical protein